MNYENLKGGNVTEKIKIYNCDCMELLKQTPDNYYSLSIVDPPYGIGAENHAGGKKSGWKQYDKKDWDSKIPSNEYFQELLRVSKNQIIWGGNYMTDFLYPSTGWVIWDKEQRNFSLADAELAWTSFNKAIRVFDFSRPKCIKSNNVALDKFHPTAKPIELYKWLLDKYAKKGDKILDTHLGSMSIAIACHDYGFELTGCELDAEYYEKGLQRINNHISQQTLFEK